MAIHRIGVIADTHGAMHPRVSEVFAGVDAIVHGGDIGGAHVLKALRAIAPVTAVEGNNDEWRPGFSPASRAEARPPSPGLDIVRVTLGDLRILLTHILPRPSKPRAEVVDALRRAPADVVVFGHSHLPHDEVIAGVRFFNPASAGPRRFDYPIAVGLFEKLDGRWHARHVPLDERSIAALSKRMNQLR